MKDLFRVEFMRKVQEIFFVCVDMNLYLDNYFDDKNVINIYNLLCN